MRQERHRRRRSRRRRGDELNAMTATTHKAAACCAHASYESRLHGVFDLFTISVSPRESRDIRKSSAKGGDGHDRDT